MGIAAARPSRLTRDEIKVLITGIDKVQGFLSQFQTLCELMTNTIAEAHSAHESIKKKHRPLNYDEFCKQIAKRDGTVGAMLERANMLTFDLGTLAIEVADELDRTHLNLCRPAIERALQNSYSARINLKIY